MATELMILALRILFVVILYAFLVQIVLVVLKDLRTHTVSAEPREAALGRLVVVESGFDGVLPGQSFQLEPINTIGRTPGNTLVIPDTFVSTEHALLALRDGEWLIEDTKSTNGTYVNRHLISRPTPVAYGDILQIGRTKLKLTK